MKKLLSIILCLVFVFCLSSCKDDANKTQIENKPYNKVEESNENKAPVEEEKIENTPTVSGEELVEKIEKLEGIKEGEERDALLAEIQEILEQAENATK